MSFWWCLTHNAVEGSATDDSGCANMDRLGPYASQEQAAAALTQAGGRVKPAILIVRGLRMAEAEALLAEHGGDLRQAEATLSG